MDRDKSRAALFAKLARVFPDATVLQAMKETPREQFVPVERQGMAYEDIPLPIGEGQTISQPYMVALMTSALEVRLQDKVLEVGTGSGYQAAVLSRLARRVVTVERIASLAQLARDRLKAMGCSNVVVRLAGKALGCPDEAPFDGIIVTAGAPARLPPALLGQLAMGGRLVIPVGTREEQDLLKVVRTQEGYRILSLGPCRFVPLIGHNGWEEHKETGGHGAAG